MPPRFEHFQLPNGLDILCEHNPAAHSMACGFFVGTGSRDEAPEINGVSHFLEHMMFKGSNRYTWEDVNRIFDELGAQYNAYTTQEMTAYYASVLPEFTDGVMEHLAHLLRPALREADFQMEKKVILEEIAMYLDEPGQRVYEGIMALHFAGHPLGKSVLGEPSVITNMAAGQMRQYFDQHYGPGNMALCVTGRFDRDHIADLATRLMGHWQPVTPTPRQQLGTLVGGDHRVIDPRLNRQYYMALTPGPSAQDPRRFAARVLADVIGDAEGSRFYWALVDNAIAEDADFGFYPHDGCGSFYISITSDPDRAAEAIDIAMAELKRAANDLTDAEVRRARNKIASQLVLQGEGSMGRLRAIGTQWLYNHDYRSLDEDMATLMAVTTADLLSLMRDYQFNPLTSLTLGSSGPAESVG